MAELVLVGGGHAHLTTIMQIEGFRRAGHRVTVIQPDIRHYYSGMGPGLLGGFYEADEISLATAAMVEKRGGVFVEDRVTRVDPLRRRLETAAGREFSYDVLSLNSGSHVPAGLLQEAAERVFPVKPIVNLLAARKYLESELGRGRKMVAAVIGGGPAALEIAGNLRRLARGFPAAGLEIRLFAGRRLLHRFPLRVRLLALEALGRNRIEVIEGERVKAVRADHLLTAAGKRTDFDLAFLATGVKPSLPGFSQPPTLGPSGGLLVNRYLQSVSFPQIFAGGDCLDFAKRPLERVGVYAVRQNPVLLHNLSAALSGSPLKEFSPGGDYLQIFNLGDGRGLICKWGMSWTGRAAFYLKDFIDRRFMRRFQD